MNYQRIYDNLIQRAKGSVKISGYTEQHHIIPKCLGGSNQNSNLVRLTAREHYIAHQLLYKIHRSPQLAHAWFNMLRVGRGQQRVFTSLQYERVKITRAKEMSASMKGANNHFFGRRHSEETKNKIREIAKRRIKTEETVSLWVEKVAKKPASDKQKRAVSIAAKNKVTLKNKHTGECVRVDRQQALMYNTEVWKNPAAVSQARSTCIHCGVTSVNGNIRRWHNENCKRSSSR